MQAGAQLRPEKIDGLVTVPSAWAICWSPCSASQQKAFSERHSALEDADEHRAVAACHVKRIKQAGSVHCRQALRRWITKPVASQGY